MANSTLTLRPRLTFFEGDFRDDLEVRLTKESGVFRVHTVRPSAGGVRDPLLLTPAFCNAHSHLEYRGLLGVMQQLDYWPWIREITRLKSEQSLDDVREHTHLAARENRATGVALIGEHSDRPFAGAALREVGIRGVIFQEVITFLEAQDPRAKLASVKAKAQTQAAEFGGPVWPSPHAPHTVDRATLARWGTNLDPFSIHVAETPLEDEWVRTGSGPIADMYSWARLELPRHASGVVGYLSDMGLARKGAQWVHGGALDPSAAGWLAAQGVAMAHCPRSNLALNCPDAPVREWLDAGVRLGLGLDSAASSGPIDMFAEMRAATSVASRRGAPLSPAEVWCMSTSGGASSLGWEDACALREGATVSLLAVHGNWTDPGSCIEKGSPEMVEWL